MFQLKRPTDECRARKIIYVDCYNRTEHINTKWEQNAGYYSFKTCSSLLCMCSEEFKVIKEFKHFRGHIDHLAIQMVFPLVS
jgi:hypothetical protein